MNNKMNNNRRNDLENEIVIAEMYIEGRANVLNRKHHPLTKEHLQNYSAVRKSMTAAKLKVISKIADSLKNSVVRDFITEQKWELNNQTQMNLYYYRVMKKLGAATGTYIFLMEKLTEKMRKHDWVCVSYRAKHTKKIQVLYFNPDKNHVIKRHLSWFENPKNPKYAGLTIDEKMIKIFGPLPQSVNHAYVPKGKLFTIVDERDNRFNEVLFKTLVRPELRDKLRTHPDFTSKFTGSCIMMRDEVDNPITDLHWLRDVFAYDNYL
jgi:hypothetical protein